MRSGGFRALQVCVRGEKCNGTPVTLHLRLMCHLRACQVSEMFPASSWCVVWHPSCWTAGEPSPNTKLCQKLSFIGALLPPSPQLKPETVEASGEWCRCITKWDYCRDVIWFCLAHRLWWEWNLPVQKGDSGPIGWFKAELQEKLELFRTVFEESGEN